MNLLNSITEHDWQGLEIKGAWMVIISTCVLVAMIIDLIAGVRKARERGHARTSYGLKRTVDKAIRYFGLMILCFLLDIIAHLLTPVPYFSIIAGIYLVVTEIISWYEKADQKEKRNADILVELLKNKDDLVKGFAEVLTKQLKEDETKRTTQQ